MYSKRSAGSDTGCTTNDRSRRFYTARARIIGLEIANVVLLVGIIGMISWVFRYDRTVGAEGIPWQLWSAFSLMALLGYLIMSTALSFVQEIFETHQRYLDNTSHAIRTPIAIMRAEAEVALMSANINADAEVTLRSLIGELDRMSDGAHRMLFEASGE